MGRARFNCCPRRFRWFRGTWSPKNDVNLQPISKPESAADEADGIPFEERIQEPNILIVRSINPCLEDNGINHRTSKYEPMRRDYFAQLVVRRGQHFKLNITLSRPYDEQKDGISFIFVVEDEPKPSHGNGTMVAIPLLRKPDRHLRWNVVLHSSDGNVITVNVLTPPDTIVAKWKMDVDTRILNGGSYCYSWDTNIYILFNPWSKTDQVFMKSEEWREESVMNDVGIVYRGTYNRIKPVVWKYDQFEKDILDCSLYLVHVVGKVKSHYRSDPVKIARALAAAINSSDDEGAVQGNWDTNHSGGTAPTKWIGSKEILQKYYKTKKPVKYGQCWVFSGVLTTGKALGIPARTITNYSSAHDTESSLTVDYYIDEKGSIIESSDSIWNFHVWNEVWMTRPDLGREYSGWQAIDATPQEMSEDIYRCGPSAVVAVKEGEVLRPYDTSFLFAEVNADKIFWRVNLINGRVQPIKLLRKDTYGIGKLILTKAPGLLEKEDITSNYKHFEKSPEERSTMLKALRQSESIFSRYYLNEDFNDIYFHMNLLDQAKIGEPFDVSLTMRNRSMTKNHPVSVILRVDAVTYQGKFVAAVKSEHFKVNVKPESTHEVKLTVTYEEYSRIKVDQSAFNISCLASIEETKFEYYAQDDFRVRKPDIKIVLRETAVETVPITADLWVENPLPVPLRKGEFTIEAPGLERKIKLKVKTVGPGEKAAGEFSFTPPTSGVFTVAAKFVSREMDDVDGHLEILVEPKKEQPNT
ncbi:hypothetical protein HUJ05_003856 [Dendroctonus ponderosae]|nr:hypothetical protein HUJ05_003856 [Dendroctonus ponderosae]